MESNRPQAARRKEARRKKGMRFMKFNEIPKGRIKNTAAISLGAV
jgi:hypothetical protein